MATLDGLALAAPGLLHPIADMIEEISPNLIATLTCMKRTKPNAESTILYEKFVDQTYAVTKGLNEKTRFLNDMLNRLLESAQRAYEKLYRSLNRAANKLNQVQQAFKPFNPLADLLLQKVSIDPCAWADKIWEGLKRCRKNNSRRPYKRG